MFEPLVPTPVSCHPPISVTVPPALLSSSHSSAVLFDDPAQLISERKTFGDPVAWTVDREGTRDSARMSPRAYVDVIKNFRASMDWPSTPTLV